MFSGIITDLGVIRAIDKQSDWTIAIETRFDMDRVKIGDSIACDGVCLTVIAKTTNQFSVQLSMETIHRTTAQHWKIGDHVNLEQSLRLGDRLDGHLVYGHVDGMARISAITPDHGSHKIAFQIPENLALYVAYKGSVTINGVSLTVNNVQGNEFTVNVIPHTWDVTGFQNLRVGDAVNIEIDIVARYVERILNYKSGTK